MLASCAYVARSNPTKRSLQLLLLPTDHDTKMGAKDRGTASAAKFETVECLNSIRCPSITCNHQTDYAAVSAFKKVDALLIWQQP